jgi:hypothetical protein
MKTPTFLLLPVIFLTSVALLRAEESADLTGPKAVQPQLLRVLLHLPGTGRLIDYPDVERIVCCDAGRIVFATQDGQIVVHQGGFTVVVPRDAPPAATARPSASGGTIGPRFYDPK